MDLVTLPVPCNKANYVPTMLFSSEFRSLLCDTHDNRVVDIVRIMIIMKPINRTSASCGIREKRLALNTIYMILPKCKWICSRLRVKPHAGT